MSTSDSENRKLKINEELRIDAAKKVIFRDDDIYIYSDADGYIRIVADTGIKLDSITTMQTGKQLNATADGVATLSKAGTISDADFTTDTTGLIAIDTSNDRIYYRIGAANWSYVSADGSFSFPQLTCPICEKEFEVDDVLALVVDGFDPDGAPHATAVHQECI